MAHPPRGDGGGGLWIAHFVASVGVARALGGGRPAQQLGATLGRPSWFFWSGSWWRGAGGSTCELARPFPELPPSRAEGT